MLSVLTVQSTKIWIWIFNDDFHTSQTLLRGATDTDFQRNKSVSSCPPRPFSPVTPICCVWLSLSYPVILSIENHCSVPQQKKMAQYLIEILGDKLDLSNIKADESGWLPSPETLKGKILVKVTSECGCTVKRSEVQFGSLKCDWFSSVWEVSPQAIISAHRFIICSLNLTEQTSKAGDGELIEVMWLESVLIWHVWDGRKKNKTWL